MFSSSGNAFSARESDGVEEIHLNLTPMIDVLTCLLFFLLLSFGAVLIALINASVPVVADGTPETSSSKTSITLGVSVSKKEIFLTISSDALSEVDMNKLKRSFHAKKDGFDYPSLNKYCYELKQRFQESRSVVITPDPDVDYAVLVAIMDATREWDTTRKGRQFRLPLFPEAVVSTMVK